MDETKKPVLLSSKDPILEETETFCCCLKRKKRRAFFYDEKCHCPMFEIWYDCNPCRIVETVFILLFLFSVGFIIYGAGKTFGSATHKKHLELLIYHGKDGAFKTFSELEQAAPQGHEIAEYIKSYNFEKMFWFCFGVGIAISILMAVFVSQFLVTILYYLMWVIVFGVSIITVILFPQALDYLGLSNVPAQYIISSILALLIILTWLAFKQHLELAKMCIELSFAYLSRALLFVTIWSILMIALKVTWVFLCLAAFLSINAGENNLFDDKIFTMFWFVLCAYWGHYFLSYFNIAVYGGAIGRHCLTDDQEKFNVCSDFRKSIHAATFVLIGPIIFGSFCIALIEAIIYALMPRKEDEDHPLSGLPLIGPGFTVLSQGYSYVMNNYLICILKCLKEILQYITEYAVVICTIYGDTLCASAIRMTNMNMFDILANEAVTAFIVFMIVNIVSLSNAGITWLICKNGLHIGDFEIEPAPEEQFAQFSAVAIYLISYVINSTLFGPIRIFSRSCLVCYTFEKDAFEICAHPEIYTKTLSAHGESQRLSTRSLLSDAIARAGPLPSVDDLEYSGRGPNLKMSTRKPKEKK